MIYWLPVGRCLSYAEIVYSDWLSYAGGALIKIFNRFNCIFYLQAGGFVTPFAVVAGACFLTLPLVYYYLPKQDGM